ncbi:MAG: hypothetical protein ACKOCO_15950, partial [Bacteroidota bacterium]
MRHSLFILSLLCAATLSAQSTLTIHRSLKWSDSPRQWTTPEGDVVDVWKFEDCTYGNDAMTLPLFTVRFALDGQSDISASLQEAAWEAFKPGNNPDLTSVGAEAIVSASTEQERQQYFGRINMLPFRKTGNTYERLVSFTIIVNVIPVVAPAPVNTRGFTETSVLSSGNVYKFGVENSGIYKLDYNYIRNELGVTDIDNIDPRTIRIYGNGGAMLPEKNGDARPDDLLENAIVVVGESDGKFNTGDYILFYAVGPRPWNYRQSVSDPVLTTRVNLYDERAWYFLKTGEGTG